jgi:hypothetical protein
MLRQIRPANIPKKERDLFEQYGENVIGMVLSSSFTPAASALTRLQGDDDMKAHARDWLTERADAHEQREQRLEILEWAIVGLIVIEIILDIVLKFRR